MLMSIINKCHIALVEMAAVPENNEETSKQKRSSKKAHKEKHREKEREKASGGVGREGTGVDGEHNAANADCEVDAMLDANDVPNMIKAIVAADTKDHSAWKQMLRDICDLIKWDRHGFAVTKISHVRFPEEYVLRVDNTEFLHNAISVKYFKQKFSNMPHIQYECVANHMVKAINFTTNTYDVVALQVTYTKEGMRSGLLPLFIQNDQPRVQSTSEATPTQVSGSYFEI